MEVELQYVEHHLYGGAITADLPIKFLDASDLRQIPDHQEVFLSNTSLTSIIFEINTYQRPAMIDSQQQENDGNALSSEDENKRASTFHFYDPIDPSDRIDSGSSLTTPRRTVLPKPSLSAYPSYTQSGTITTVESDRTTNRTNSILPNEWHQSPPTINFDTKVYQLLVRLQEYDTDLCVRINVPLKEFTGTGAAFMSMREMDLGQEIMEKIVASLAVKNFDLFGAAE